MPVGLELAGIYSNYTFTAYFVLEMGIKLTGLGPSLYLADSFNIFDALVTIVGAVEMVLSLAPGMNANNGAMSVFRAFRLLRLFRLARAWTGLNRIIAVLLSAVLSVGWITLLLFLFLFIAALLGMTFFGFKLDSCPQVRVAALIKSARGEVTRGRTCDSW